MKRIFKIILVIILSLNNVVYGQLIKKLGNILGESGATRDEKEKRYLDNQDGKRKEAKLVDVVNNFEQQLNAGGDIQEKKNIIFALINQANDYFSPYWGLNLTKQKLIILKQKFESLKDQFAAQLYQSEELLFRGDYDKFLQNVINNDFESAQYFIDHLLNSTNTYYKNSHTDLFGILHTAETFKSKLYDIYDSSKSENLEKNLDDLKQLKQDWYKLTSKDYPFINVEYTKAEGYYR